MLEQLTSQLVARYRPVKILLFGSQANGTATDLSDVDVCVVVDTDNKRRLLADMYYVIDIEKPVDILLYTPAEWEACLADQLSFAYKINREGVVLYG